MPAIVVFCRVSASAIEAYYKLFSGFIVGNRQFASTSPKPSPNPVETAFPALM